MLMLSKAKTKKKCKTHRCLQELQQAMHYKPIVQRAAAETARYPMYGEETSNRNRYHDAVKATKECCNFHKPYNLLRV
jgi:hypothetical protein